MNVKENVLYIVYYFVIQNMCYVICFAILYVVCSVMHVLFVFECFVWNDMH